MSYEPLRRELVIVFRGGRGTYCYFDVPLEEWQAFQAAESKGMYLNQVFKPKEYRFEKVLGESRVYASGFAKDGTT